MLAGCFAGGEAQAPPDPLTATASTGLLLGVVVDQGIRPLAGANVTVSTAPPRSTTTGEDGAFGFAGLTPGSYALAARMAGHAEAQTVAEVVAGVQEPPIVQMVLVFDPGLAAYAETYVWEGYIECGSYVPVVGHFAICTAGPTLNAMLCPLGVCPGNVTADNIFTFYLPPAVPAWAQGELVWTSNQQLGQGLQLFLSHSTPENAAGTGFDGNMNVTRGPSPLLGTVNATVLADSGVGLGSGIMPRVYPAPYDPTVQCLPSIGCDGAGAAVEQRFTLFLHLFYNYRPPADWRFSQSGDVPGPALLLGGPR